MHKVGIYVLLKFEDQDSYCCQSHILNLNYYVQSKYASKFIRLATITNTSPLEVVQNTNIANFVYYGKNSIL